MLRRPPSNTATRRQERRAATMLSAEYERRSAMHARTERLAVRESYARPPAREDAAINLAAADDVRPPDMFDGWFDRGRGVLFLRHGLIMPLRSDSLQRHPNK